MKREIFWQKEVLRGYSSRIKIHRRKLELQKEAIPKITVSRVIVGDINMDKVTTWVKYVELKKKKKSQTLKEHHVKGRRKEETKESLERGSLEIEEAEEGVQLKPRGKKDAKSKGCQRGRIS